MIFPGSITAAQHQTDALRTTLDQAPLLRSTQTAEYLPLSPSALAAPFPTYFPNTLQGMPGSWTGPQSAQNYQGFPGTWDNAMWTAVMNNLMANAMRPPHEDLANLVPNVQRSAPTSAPSAPGHNYEPLEDATPMPPKARRSAPVEPAVAGRRGSSAPLPGPKLATPGSRGPPPRTAQAAQEAATNVPASTATAPRWGTKPPVFVESKEKQTLADTSSKEAYTVEGLKTRSKYSPVYYNSKSTPKARSSEGDESHRQERYSKHTKDDTPRESDQTSRNSKKEDKRGADRTSPNTKGDNTREPDQTSRNIKKEDSRGTDRTTPRTWSVSVAARRPTETSSGSAPRRQSTTKRGESQTDQPLQAKRPKVVSIDDAALEALTQRFTPAPPPKPPLPPQPLQSGPGFPPQPPATN